MIIYLLCLKSRVVFDLFLILRYIRKLFHIKKSKTHFNQSAKQKMRHMHMYSMFLFERAKCESFFSTRMPAIPELLWLKFFKLQIPHAVLQVESRVRLFSSISQEEGVQIFMKTWHWIIERWRRHWNEIENILHSKRRNVPTWNIWERKKQSDYCKAYRAGGCRGGGGSIPTTIFRTFYI